MEQGIEFRQVRSFEQKINASFAFIRQNLKPFLKTILFIGGPAIVVGALGYGIFMNFYTDIVGMTARGNTGSGYEDLIDNNLFYYIGAIFIFMLGAFTGLILLWFASGYYVRLYVRGERDITPGMVWDNMKGRMLRYSGGAILLVIALFTLIGGLIGLMSILISLFLPGFLIFLLSMVLVTGYFYVIIVLSLLPIVYINEDISFTDALRRTFQLIRGNWWRTAGLLAITFIIIFMLSMILAIPQYIFMMMSIMHDVTDQAAEMPAWMGIATAVSSAFQYGIGTLLYSLVVVTLSFHYFSLVEERERRGLMDKISSIGGTQGTDTSLESY